jgi:hypothetical protein
MLHTELFITSERADCASRLRIPDYPGEYSSRLSVEGVRGQVDTLTHQEPHIVWLFCHTAATDCGSCVAGCTTAAERRTRKTTAAIARDQRYQWTYHNSRVVITYRHYVRHFVLGIMVPKLTALVGTHSTFFCIKLR